MNAPLHQTRAKAGTLDLLREEIAALSGIPAGLRSAEGKILAAGSEPRLAFGIAGLDRRLGGGLLRSGLHEFRSAQTRGSVAMAGFAAAVCAGLGGAGAILWIMRSGEERETGGLYGPGLAALGLDPARLVIVRARRVQEALWAFEEGLRCRGLAAVIGEIADHPKALDLTASRRLAVRAREEGVTGLLLRPGSEPDASAALTRWLVAPAVSAGEEGFADHLGPAAWRLELERNRFGPLGRFDVEWDHGQRRFIPLARKAVPVAGPALSPHRPAAAAPLRSGEALRRTG
jgi:protein ImuA